MSNIKLKRYFLLFVLLGLSAGFSIAQDQTEQNQEMITPPGYDEAMNKEHMAPPPYFDKNASETYRMRRPPRRRDEIGSGTMDMFPPDFEGNASGTFRMRRPPRRHHIGSGTLEMMPPAYEGEASGTYRMRRPPMPPMGGRPPRE